MKFDYQQLLDQRPRIHKLEVQCFEMNVYLIKLYVQSRSAQLDSGMLYQNAQLMRFYSTLQIRANFALLQVDSAVMLHESAYDEMIGNPPKAKGSMALPFSLQQAD